MESFKDNNLGFYILIYKFNQEIWIRGKDLCISLEYKYYKQVIERNVSKETKSTRHQI